MPSTSELNLALGATIGEIIQNPTRRAAFAADPAAELTKLGVTPEITVYADTADTVHLIIPAKIDETRVQAGDEAYFEDLGRLALAACYYEEMPD